MPAGVDTHAGTGSAAGGRDPRLAGQAATLAARAHLALTGSREPIDLALVFASGRSAQDAAPILEAVAELSEAQQIVGCSASAVSTEAGTLEDGVAVMLLQGSFAVVASTGALERDPAGAARSLARKLHRRGEGPGAVLLLLDPRSLRGPAFLDALRDALPPGTPIFGGAAGLTAGRCWVAGGPTRPRPPVAQADAVVAIGLPEMPLRFCLAPVYPPDPQDSQDSQEPQASPRTAAFDDRQLRLEDPAAPGRLRDARFALLIDGPHGVGPGPVATALPGLPLIGWLGPRLIAPIEARPAELIGGSALIVASDP